MVDDYARRQTVAETGSDSLTPVLNLHQRVAAWKELSGRSIDVHLFDLCEYEPLDQLVKTFRPEAIVHYGQIPSAPYSMQDRRHAIFTQRNNIENNLNVIFAIIENDIDCQLVKLGTMGEYGCPNIDIEEGFIEIEHNGRKDTLPFPKMPHSWYHASKVADSTNIHFASRVYGLRATDLNQGVVYGVHTDETLLDDRLLTRYDYDEQFGTALNRFCVQALIGYPMTVYGKGAQQRGFLNIRDTLSCVELAVAGPPNAARCGSSTSSRSPSRSISWPKRCRRRRSCSASRPTSARSTTLAPRRPSTTTTHVHTKLLDLGLNPTLLSEDLVSDTLSTLQRFKDV